jgi:hypothetical protein
MVAREAAREPAPRLVGRTSPGKKLESQAKERGQRLGADGRGSFGMGEKKGRREGYRHCCSAEKSVEPQAKGVVAQRATATVPFATSPALMICRP